MTGQPRTFTRANRRGRDQRLDPSQLPGDTQDDWLDQPSQDTGKHPSGFRGLLRSWQAVPGQYGRRIEYYILTTPGRMITLTIVLAVAIFAAGYSMSHSSAERQRNLDELLTVTEPTNFAAHTLYAQLSLADTVTTTSLVRVGNQAEREQREYHEAIDAASLAASEVAAGITNGDDDATRLIAAIQRGIPTYTGLVETARANNRQGNPVAFSYAATASALLREEILPAAQALFAHTSRDVEEAQAEVTRPQFVPLSGLLAAVLFLLIAQWWLWRKTHRRLNKGFLAATAMMSVAILWVAGSNVVTWRAGSQGFAQAAKPWDMLTDSRIAAQHTRAAETLALVRREPIGHSGDPFTDTTTRIAAALDAAEANQLQSSDGEAADPEEHSHTDLTIAEARRGLDEWSRAHEELSAELMAGHFHNSEHLATDTTVRPGEPATTATAFARLDRALTDLIVESRKVIRSFIADGLAATTSVAASVLVLSLASILAIVIGIRPRFQEYL